MRELAADVASAAARASVGGESYVESKGKHERRSELTLALKEGVFDEERFLVDFESRVRQEVVKFGVRIENTEKMSHGWRLDYLAGSRHGSIVVSGEITGEKLYTLRSKIEEYDS